MLQKIRDKISGWFAAVFLGAVALVFVFWGIDFQAGAIPDAARVNGEKISADSMLRAWQERQSQLQQMLRAELPADLVKSQQAALLDERIRTTLLTQRTKEMGYRVSDEEVAQTILGFSELQVDGKFSRDRYAAILNQQGRTEAQFENELRTNLGLNQLQGGIATSAFVTPRELERRRALENEQREVEYAVLPASAFAAAVSVTDADIQAWYDSHLADYMTPETVDVEFLDLRLADVERSIEVTEDALKAYYDQAKDRFATQERRKARHVLITTSDKLDDAGAKKLAEEVLAKAKAGEDFAKLAEQYSQDTGSAKQGGDLGWATRGMFVGPFEDAIFGMTAGELRGPVKTEFGYHVMRLDEIEAGHQKTFDEVRAEIEPEFRKEKAQAAFYERGQKMADESFTALTELGTVAASLGMELKKVAGFTRQGGGELGMDAQIIAAAFGAEVADRGQNSPLIAVGDDRAVVLRVSSHHQPEQMPLSAVREPIQARLRQNAARDAAARKGNELLAQLEAGSQTWAQAAQQLNTQLKVAASPRRFVGRQDKEVPPAVLKTVFALPRSALKQGQARYQTSAMENGDFVVLAVTSLKDGNATDEAAAERAQRGRRTAQQVAAEEFSAYLAELERTAKIQRNLSIFQ
ncbi:MAG: SurA N-terminal domain-containing protein [Steroidobacteraceae bacterium]